MDNIIKNVKVRIWECEKNVLEFAERKRFIFFLVIITLLGLLVRIPGLDFVSTDAEWFLLPWFEEIRKAGGMSGLANQVGDYNIVYQFLISCMTYLPFDPLCMYKGLSIIFDFILAGAVGVTVYRISEKSQYSSVLAYAVTLFVPTHIINSSVWAQCDSIFTSMLVITLYCLYYKKYKMAFAFYGLAGAFKLQAVFLLPFLLFIYILEKKFSIFNFVISLAVFYLTCIPGFVYGRTLWDPVKIYLSQSGEYHSLCLNFPNLWAILDGRYGVFRSIAILLTVAVLGIGMLYLLQMKPDICNAEYFLGIAIWTVWSCVLFLPSMHDRYGYLLDVLLIILAFVKTRYMPFAFATVMSSCISYGPFLLEKEINIRAVAVFYIMAYFVYTYVLTSSHGLMKKKEYTV